MFSALFSQYWTLFKTLPWYYEVGIVYGLLIVLAMIPVVIFALTRMVVNKEQPFQYIWPPLFGLIVGTSTKFICPVLCLIAMLLRQVKWNDKPTTGSDGGAYGLTIRGRYTGIFTGLNTWDEMLPGTMDLVPLVKLFNWANGIKPGLGKWVAGWYWTAVRNTAMEFAIGFGKPATGYFPNTTDTLLVRDDNVWQKTMAIGGIGIKFGYEIWAMKVKDENDNVIPDQYLYATAPYYSFKR